jgi:glycerol uptake facilitator-like aquaporin
MSVSRPNRGPSSALVEWRRFIVETLMCFELMAVIAVVGFGASHNLFAAAAVGALVTAVLRILWRR